MPVGRWRSGGADRARGPADGGDRSARVRCRRRAALTARRGKRTPARGARPPSDGRGAISGRERLQKILASAGIASRRHSEEYLRAGRVTVNGKLASLGDSADPRRDRIELDGEPIRRERASYWIVHKPRGVLTTVSDPEGRPTVVDLVPDRARRLFPVGRLDRDTEGLVLMTNDGAIAHRLLHPSHGNEREYRVTVRGEISEASLERLAKGVALEDGVTAPARVGPVRREAATVTTSFALTVREGRKRQIRRAMSALGHPVVRLVRVRMGPLRLGRLALGEARPLRGDERSALARLLDAHPPESRVQVARELRGPLPKSRATP